MDNLKVYIEKLQNDPDLLLELNINISPEDKKDLNGDRFALKELIKDRTDAVKFYLKKNKIDESRLIIGPRTNHEGNKSFIKLFKKVKTTTIQTSTTETY